MTIIEGSSSVSSEGTPSSSSKDTSEFESSDVVPSEASSTSSSSKPSKLSIPVSVTSASLDVKAFIAKKLIPAKAITRNMMPIIKITFLNMDTSFK